MAVIEDQAFVTAIAHACKHPYTTVVGLLLGKSDGKTVTVTKAVPLVHHNHQLTMATEAALMQVDEYCIARQLSIVGIYQALEDATARPFMDPFGKRLADKIKSQFKDAIALMINGQSLSADVTDTAKLYEMYSSDSDNKWGSINSTTTVNNNCLQTITAMMATESYKLVADFDEFLADATADFFNTELTL